MYYTFIAVCLLILSATTHAASCNYATFSVKTLYPTLNIGIFSLSTNRCQALKATLKLHESFLGFKFELPFDGSLKLKCEAQPNEEYRVGVALFSDPLCNEPVSMNGDDDEEDDAGDRSIYVDMTKNNKFTIYEDIQFSLDEMSCDAGQTSCGISMEMAKNCSWSDSERYINISVPDAHCVSLAPDFGSVLSKIPFEILPEEMVDDLETASLKFQCCHSDNSLLISNYSDTSCSSDFGSFRISQAMNGQCFVIGNEDDFVGDEVHRMDSNDSYVFLLKWQCNAFQHGCDGLNIPILDESMLPQKCSDDCMKRPTKQPSTSPTNAPSISSTASQPTNAIKSGITTTVPIHTNNEDKRDSQSNGTFLQDNLLYIAIGGAIVCFVLLCAVFVCLYCKKKKQLQKALDQLDAQHDDVELPDTRTKRKRNQFGKTSKDKYEKFTD
eukprot:554215_1